MRITTLPRIAALVIILLSATAAQAQFKVLHYAETSGFDHQTRQQSLQMLQTLGAENNFTVDDDPDGSAFNSLGNLQQYAVVVFANTSGDAILDVTQRTNFENYMNNGGSFLGIHAASDTYRHSTANGSNTGAWDWYAEMLGASVQQNPNHVAGTPEYDMHKINLHPSTAHLPDLWTKNEEYYYWENGYYNSANSGVLEVEQTTGPNGQVNSYDSARPMSWYKELPGGGRSFYTALGHAASNYESDTLFITHLRDAVLWAAGVVTSMRDAELEDGFTIQHVTRSSLQIWFGSVSDGENVDVLVYDISGRVIATSTLFASRNSMHTITLPGISRGVYFVKMEFGGREMVRKVVVNQ